MIVSVGYELQPFDPVRINPAGDKQIIHLSRVPPEVDARYVLEVGIQADIANTLGTLGEATTRRFAQGTRGEKIRRLLADELAQGVPDDSFPLRPQRIVANTRAALGRSDIVLADTGAVKMWMARLYPTFEPNTCLISNGLSTMAVALPGAIAAKLAPGCKVLAAVGDGAFLMNSQEIETAPLGAHPLTILIWEDDAYGLIGWKRTSSSVVTWKSDSPIPTSWPSPRASGPGATERVPRAICFPCSLKPWPPTPCR